MTKRKFFQNRLRETIKASLHRYRSVLAVVSTGFILTACGGASTESDSSAGDNNLSSVDLSLGLPDSVTGGEGSGSSKTQSVSFAKASAAISGNTKPSDEPCAFIGTESDDPFVNGYETTKFMVSSVAAWSCVAELLIDIAEFAPHDGTIIETENDLSSESYEADEPTHYSVVDDSEVQTTIRLYYGFDRELPPTNSDDAGFYLSWTEGEDGTVRGRVVVDVSALDEVPEEDDPVAMRMDFSHDDASKVHDMFLRFDAENPWADGLRIRVTKDLEANPLEQVFQAKGLMAMTAQFIPGESISELPEIAFYSVANRMGDGASIAQVQDLSIVLPLANTHLGEYLTTKEDVYVFDDDQDWEWVNKQFTAAEFRGGRTAPAEGGSWVPFDPSLDMIETALELGEGYFAGECSENGDDCTAFMNGVFLDGFADQEPNQGEDPNDWRSLSLQGATYLNSVYPNGVDWTDAFNQEFQP